MACQRGGQAHFAVVIVHIHGEQRGLVQVPRFPAHFSGLVLADGLQQPRQRMFQFQIVQNIPYKRCFAAENGHAFLLSCPVDFHVLVLLSVVKQNGG